MTKALTIDQYEKWVGEYLDFLRQHGEESGEEMVIMVGGFAGSASVNAPSEANENLRIGGSVGFHEDAFEGKPGAQLLMSAMGSESWRRHLLGSVAFPRSELSENIEERIAEQQQQMAEHYPEMGNDGGSEEVESE